jgi:hypothetical protein
MMKRHYYISDDLEDLADVGKELINEKFTPPQFHVLSNDDAALSKHNLHEVESVLKQDVVHSTELGAVIGVALATVILAGANLLGLTATAAGWVPFVFLAVVVLGFCTWEGGLIGIQIPNYQFARFQDVLNKGKHVFFVDIEDKQAPSLAKIVSRHPHLQLAGMGESTPRWVIRGQDNYTSFMKMMP